METVDAIFKERLQHFSLIVLGFTAVLMGLGIAIARSITVPLGEAVQVAKTVTAGDLGSQIHVHGSDETGQLLQALADMNNNLHGIVGQVRSGTETIASAAGEVASGNLDLSSRTEQQASSLEETASSMEELTSTVKQNGDNARQANMLAVSASGVALKGGAVIKEVVQTMGEISTASKEQEAGIEQINQAITEMDTVTQQNASLVEEASSAAAALQEQAMQLAQMVSVFRLNANAPVLTPVAGTALAAAPGLQLLETRTA